MKGERPVVLISREIAAVWGPLLQAQLERGEVIDVAGTLMQLRDDRTLEQLLGEE